jgi:hypothetical protein
MSWAAKSYVLVLPTPTSMLDEGSTGKSADPAIPSVFVNSQVVSPKVYTTLAYAFGVVEE